MARTLHRAHLGDHGASRHQIEDEAREAFLEAGGQDFRYIACLNDQAAWIEALADVSEQHLAGWATMQGPDLQALARSRDEALALGAAR